MQDIITLIQNVGFPIACCVGLAFWLNKREERQYKDTKEDKDRLYNNLDKLNDSNKEIVDSNRTLVETNKTLAENVCGDIKNIKVGMENMALQMEHITKLCRKGE